MEFLDIVGLVRRVLSRTAKEFKTIMKTRNNSVETGNRRKNISDDPRRSAAEWLRLR